MATVSDMERRANALVQEHAGGTSVTGPVRDPSVGQIVDPGDNQTRIRVPAIERGVSVQAPPPVEGVGIQLVDLRSSVALTSFGSFLLNEMEHAGVCRIVLESVARRMNETIDLLRENTGVNELERKTNEQIEVMRQNLVAQAAKEAGTPPQPQIVEAEILETARTVEQAPEDGPSIPESARTVRKKK